MTGFTPELIERVGFAIQQALADNSLCSVHEHFERRAVAALEASGIAELTEALRYCRKTFERLIQTMPETSEAYELASEHQVHIDAVLAKYQGASHNASEG